MTRPPLAKIQSSLIFYVPALAFAVVSLIRQDDLNILSVLGSLLLGVGGVLVGGIVWGLLYHGMSALSGNKVSEDVFGSGDGGVRFSAGLLLAVVVWTWGLSGRDSLIENVASCTQDSVYEVGNAVRDLEELVVWCYENRSSSEDYYDYEW